MLKLIKRFFGSKERIGLTLETLEPWFDKKTKKFYDSNKSKIKELIEKIKEEIPALKENIIILEQAKLQNENITPKERHYMDGNREFYTKRISLFIETLQIPEEITFESVEKIQKEINEIGKATAKAYQILQHFFANESYQAAQIIKNLDNYVIELKNNLADPKIIEIEDIKAKIEDIKNMLNKEKDIKKEMKDIENKVVELEEEKKSIHYDISKKEQSKEYREYHTIEVEQHKLNEQLDDIKEDMAHYFAVLEHALKKQAKIDISYEELINRYLADPITTLAEDKNLDILHILKKMEDCIRNDVIDLKDKKVEKTLDVIRTLDKIRVFSFLKEYNDLKVQLKNNEEKMKLSTILKEIDMIKEKMDDKDDEIWKLNNQLDKMNEEFSKINIKKTKKDLTGKINDFLDIELDIDQE